MNQAPPSAFAVDFDELDPGDREQVAALCAQAAAAIDQIDATIADSRENFAAQMSVAALFIGAAEQVRDQMAASYDRHTRGLEHARASADAVLQFARRLSSSLDTAPTDRPTRKGPFCDRDHAPFFSDG